MLVERSGTLAVVKEKKALCYCGGEIIKRKG